MSKRMKSLCILAAFAIAYVSGWLILEFVEPFIAVAIFVAVAVSGGAVLRWRKVPMLGPLFWFDFARMTRRRRHYLMRAVFGLTLLVVLVLIHHQWARQVDIGGEAINGGGMEAAGNALALLSQRFSQSIIVILNIATILVTPILAAGCIIEDRNHGMLDLLFTSHVHAREIIIGKLCSRLVTMGMILLVGLPITALIFPWGGVNMPLVVAGYAAAVITMLHAGAAAIFCSVKFRNYGVALYVCYLLGLAAAIAIGFLALVHITHGYWIHATPFTFLMALESQLTAAPAPRANISAIDAWRIALKMTLQYTWMHLLFVGIYIGAAIWFLRPVDVTFRGSVLNNRDKVSSKKLDDPQERPTLHQKKNAAPKVRGNPFIWLELTHPEKIWYWLIYVICWMATLFGLGVGAFMIATTMIMNDDVRQIFMMFSNGSLVSYSSVVVGLFLLAESLRTATCIVRERERRTLDALLTTPAEEKNILFAKWVAGVWAFRWMLLILLIMWGIGMLAGVLHPLAGFLLAVTVLSHFLFVTSLGLSVSMVCRSTSQAVFLMVVFLIVINIGPMLILPADLRAIQAMICPVQAWLFIAISPDAFVNSPPGMVDDFQLGSQGARLSALLYGALGVAVWL